MRRLQSPLCQLAARRCASSGLGAARRAPQALAAVRRTPVSRSSVGLRVFSSTTSSSATTGIDPEPFLQAGSLAMEQGDPDEAIRQFTLAVLANPALPTGYCFRAECRVALGDYGEAIADFTKATEIAPEMVRSRSLLCQPQLWRPVTPNS